MPPFHISEYQFICYIGLGFCLPSPLHHSPLLSCLIHDCWCFDLVSKFFWWQALKILLRLQLYIEKVPLACMWSKIHITGSASEGAALIYNGMWMFYQGMTLAQILCIKSLSYLRNDWHYIKPVLFVHNCRKFDCFVFVVLWTK